METFPQQPPALGEGNFLYGEDIESTDWLTLMQRQNWAWNSAGAKLCGHAFYDLWRTSNSPGAYTTSNDYSTEGVDLDHIGAFISPRRRWARSTEHNLRAVEVKVRGRNVDLVADFYPMKDGEAKPASPSHSVNVVIPNSAGYSWASQTVVLDVGLYDDTVYWVEFRATRESTSYSYGIVHQLAVYDCEFRPPGYYENLGLLDIHGADWVTDEDEGAQVEQVYSDSANFDLIQEDIDPPTMAHDEVATYFNALDFQADTFYRTPPEVNYDGADGIVMSTLIKERSQPQMTPWTKDGGSVPWYALFTGSSLYWQLHLRDGAGSSTNVSLSISGARPATGGWYDLTMCFSQSRAVMEVFINGSRVGSVDVGAYNIVMDDVGSVLWGAHTDEVYNPDGWMAYPTLIRKDMTSAELQKHMLWRRHKHGVY